MIAIGTYFLWLFVIMVFLLLLILILSLVSTWSIKVKKSKTFKIFISIAYIGFAFVTFLVSLEATNQIFPDFDLEQAHSWLLSISWGDSAQLAFVNLTIFSLLCLFVLLLYRIFIGVSKILDRGEIPKRQEETGINIFVGKIGKLIHVFVISMSVLSSLITIISWLNK